jgi:SnoaL-like polyketide cyclase
MVQQAFPDLHAEVHDVIAEGELVAARVTYTGTHQGEFVGIPATGKQTTISGVDFFRMQDGRQAEHWGGPDMFSFLVQAGVMPGPGRRDQARPPSSGRQQVTAARPGSRRQRAGGAGATALAWQRSSGVRPPDATVQPQQGRDAFSDRCAQATQGSSRDRRIPSTSVPAAQPGCSGPGWT